jgi:hypothetical protein
MDDNRWIICVQTGLISLAICWNLGGCNYPQLQDARQGVDQAVAELPHVPQVEHAKTLELQWAAGYDDFFAWVKEVENPCYYARVYHVFGTQLSIAEVIELYTPQLQELEWQIDDQPPQERENPISRVFIRGMHERLVISAMPEGYAIVPKEEYEQIKQRHATVFSLSLDYILPARDQC